MSEGFIDYYAMLQVGHDCDSKALEAAYRRLAKEHHPDHTKTADITKFNEVVAAYRTLRSSKKRAEYDATYFEYYGISPASPSSVGADGGDDAALSDADDHVKILMYLYKKRREDALNAGVIGYYLQEMLGCSYEHFEFHKWYLKEKGFISITEQGTLAITIQGVDHVISTSRAAKVERLMIAKSSDASL
jgi:curved DNA-binding protein